MAAGQRLTIPNRIVATHNTSDTFRPYNPNDNLGEVAPTKAPPPKKDKGCGVIGQILMIVIAVVVTAVTWGALAGPGGAFLSASGALSTTAAVGAGAIAGAAGSIASQTFGLAAGVIDEFSWKGVALAALGGVGGGLGAAGGKVGGALGKIDKALDLGTFGQGVLRGAAGSVISQSIGKITGLQDHFSWTAVATAGIMRGVVDVTSGALAGAISSATGRDLVSGMAGAVAGAAVQSLNGSSFGDNLISLLPEAIGSTIGNAVARGMTQVASERPKAVAAEAFSQIKDILGAEGKTPEVQKILAAEQADYADEIERIRPLLKSDPTEYAVRSRALVERATGLLQLTAQGRQESAAALRLLSRPDSVPMDTPEGPDPDPEVTRVSDVVVQGLGPSGEAFMRHVIDPAGVKVGRVTENAGMAISEAMERVPGAKTAITIVDWGLKIAGGPVRYAMGEVAGRAQQKATEIATERYEKAGYGEVSARQGGIGIPTVAVLAMTGVSGLLKAGRGGIPKLSSGAGSALQGAKLNEHLR